MRRNSLPDIAILGGGLAGGLIALALQRARPEIRTLIVEEGETLGGNHVWSFFASDLDAEGAALVEPLISHRWDGYEVRFPAHRRRLDTPYRSIRSADFDRVLRASLPADAVRTGTSVIGASPKAAVLEGGERIEAKAVIDCRGAGDLSTLSLGWQKFVGVELLLGAPHGIDRPVVMDATVEQRDGYRFVYLLPFDERRIFVEDTYYSDLPAMDAATLEGNCLEYARAQGWQVDQVLHREKGVLPVTKNGGRFEAYWQSGGKAAKAGARAGLFHPTTGFSLPEAVRSAIAITRCGNLCAEELRPLMKTRAERRWRAGSFYRMLDSMLFNGATTADRYKILERFYTLDPALIERFYAGRSSLFDKLRIVTGKPPIPITRGISAILRRGR